MGFCRTNLFKRLESSGEAFLQSLERHILRNYIFLHALRNNLSLPVGTQGAELLDARINDEDEETITQADLFDNDDGISGTADDTGLAEVPAALRCTEDFRRRAADVYAQYATRYKNRFKWVQPGLFVSGLADDLQRDADALLCVLQKCPTWDPKGDTKLAALVELVSHDHPVGKVLIFTQFADTVHYLTGQLKRRGVTLLEGVTGRSENPTSVAWRFSPVSNERRDRVAPDEELRVVVATDVLSEGQNLQDASVVVNYDLPWAIIRLVQRAGRVDRIGQLADRILCYSFWPADGVERILRLRQRVRQRLRDNAEVVGTDEAFFDDDANDQAVVDLYNEKAGILDGEEDAEVDLASYAYQIWQNAVRRDPRLEKSISAMPPVVYATKVHQPGLGAPPGALVYMSTAEGNDALAWVDSQGNSVTESQFAILRAAECAPDTPPLPRAENHHELVRAALKRITEEEKSVGGQLGRPSGARFRTYERLKRHAESVRGTLFDIPPLHRALEEIYQHPLRPSATDTLNRQLRSGISDQELAELVIRLSEDDRLCIMEEEPETQEPSIICSLGLRSTQGDNGQ
jgi:hypothetical protein